MIGALCESPLTFEALTVWRDELNEGKVLLRDIIDLEAMYGGVPGADAPVAAPGVPPIPGMPVPPGAPAAAGIGPMPGAMKPPMAAAPPPPPPPPPPLPPPPPVPPPMAAKVKRRR